MLGSSIALAAKNAGWNAHMFVRREEAVSEAKSIGLDHVFTDLQEAVVGAELIILATPVGAMLGLAGRLLDCDLAEDCLITDIGSVKGMVHSTLIPVFQKAGVDFLGSHPMAGSEKTGISAADPDLLKGAMSLLTDDGFIGHESQKNRLSDFWKSLGCKTTWITATAHDEAVARISHLPHILSAIAAHEGLEDPRFAEFAAGGFRDTTRVAAGDPAMWAEILLENKQAVEDSLSSSIGRLSEMLAMMRESDHEGLYKLLAEAQKRRQHYHQTVLSP